ncbi:hypothetical protein TSOC_006054 [Tetrabaena socialis]|uniref:Uncharacterized protein n=1 Tax=Tetrabaena socialis TaxID=47790 RepID=A0A2J8A4P5_9CHLO|nr:hypothetical protein TSOC_006054 [Tetrabaena socialis]|eukprot:PNH07490.1 hypothetical protein TSOC_006054 [Tetrabaena socialis]
MNACDLFAPLPAPGLAYVQARSTPHPPSRIDEAASLSRGVTNGAKGRVCMRLGQGGRSLPRAFRLPFGPEILTAPGAPNPIPGPAWHCRSRRSSHVDCIGRRPLT